MSNRTVSIFLALISLGCKETATNKLSAEVSGLNCRSTTTDIYSAPSATMLTDADGNNVGYFIEADEDCVWVQDAIDPSYHYAINPANGELRDSAGLVFSDSECTAPVGEEFDYPLHLGGDVYVFQFEGVFYEYPIFVPDVWVPVGEYFYRANGGAECVPYSVELESVRVIQPSSFSRVMVAPVGM